jgi:predicted MFS family arabinose efflux permease
MVAKISIRPLGMTGLAMSMLGGAVMVIASGYPILLAGRILSGTGAALLSVELLKLMMDHISPERRTGLMGTFVAG